VIAARLHAYLPGGAALGFLPTPLRADATSVVNDVGSLEVDYSTLTAGGPHVERALASGLEIALEVHNGTAWTEPPGCRYVRIAAKGDVTDKMRQRSLTMPSYAWLLRRARILQGAVYPAGHAQAGKRGFEAPTVGSILVTLLAENAARNGVPLVPIFSATQDSAGAAWPTLDNQAFDWGTDYLSILQALTDGGYVDWRTQGRGLYCYRPGTGPTSADLSASVRLRLGIDLGSAPEDESLE
jgi:hypothetical protein